jgi:hypothetical protein
MISGRGILLRNTFQNTQTSWGRMVSSHKWMNEWMNEEGNHDIENTMFSMQCSNTNVQVNAEFPQKLLLHRQNMEDFICSRFSSTSPPKRRKYFIYRSRQPCTVFGTAVTADTCSALCFAHKWTSLYCLTVLTTQELFNFKCRKIHIK